MNTTTIEESGGLGFLTYIEEPSRICVVSLYVKREHRMQGIAGRLLHRLCQHADAQRAIIMLSVVALDHGPETLPFGLLRDFYMRRGFVDEGGYTSHLTRYPQMVVNEHESQHEGVVNAQADFQET